MKMSNNLLWQVKQKLLTPALYRGESGLNLPQVAAGVYGVPCTLYLVHNQLTEGATEVLGTVEWMVSGACAETCGRTRYEHRLSLPMYATGLFPYYS